MSLAKHLKKTKPYKKALRAVKRVSRDNLLGNRLPRIYREAAAQPVDERKVVFFEDKLNDMPDAYNLIWSLLEERYDFDLRYITLRHNTVRYKEYASNCEEFVRELATARYVFLNDASDVVSCVPLRPETKVVQLWHACGAFKKWGMSTADLKFGGSRAQLMRHPFYKNLDLVTVSSPEVEWAYREAMVLEDTPEVVQPLGVSRTDVFFDSVFRGDARDAAESIFPECVDKKILLYAPTFRGHVQAAKGPDQLDIAALKAALEDDYVLFVKHHPFVSEPPGIPAGCESFAFQVDGLLAMDQLLCIADVCITDYSSVVFEYSLLERPMAFFSPDLDEYGDWRGFYYDYDALTPGPVFQDSESLVDWLSHIDERYDESVVETFRNRFMAACDGHATERIVEATFGEAIGAHRRCVTLPELVDRNPNGADISVIVPAYNAEESLPRALDSLVGQTFERNRMEIVVVDDCSSDATCEIARDYAERYPGVVVVAQTPAPSGSPAEPRNIGLGLATGEYVFFLDADDWLAPQAVAKMLAHAVEWNSDVLAVKMRGHCGREVPGIMFDGDYPAVDVYESKLMWTFAPLKLFRRSLVENMRFPAFMPEDISFVLRAFVAADVVSVASDYDYYHVGFDVNANVHASLGSWQDVATNLEAYNDLFGFVGEHIAEEDQDHTLMRRLMRRDVLRTFITIGRMDAEEGLAWHRRLVELTKPFYREGNYQSAPCEKRLVLEAAYTWGYEALRALIRELDKGESTGSYRFLSYRAAGDEIVCEATLAGSRFGFTTQYGTRSRASVRQVSCPEEGRIALRGTMSASHAFAADPGQFDAAIVAKHDETGETRAWPCAVAWDSVNISVDDDYPAKGVWRATVNAFDLGGVPIEDAAGGDGEGEELEARWRLYLVLSSDGISKDARLNYPGISYGRGRALTSVTLSVKPKAKCLLTATAEGRMALVERLG